MIKELLEFVKWIRWLAKHPLEQSRFPLWIKGFTLYVNGESVFKNDGSFYHIVIVANDCRAFEGAATKIKTFNHALSPEEVGAEWKKASKE